jgi:hypothetical protein
MRLAPVVTSLNPEHVTACPFVLPDTPLAVKPVSSEAASPAGLFAAGVPAPESNLSRDKGLGAAAVGGFVADMKRDEGPNDPELADLVRQPSHEELGT